jgi:hypothetical protein
VGSVGSVGGEQRSSLFSFTLYFLPLKPKA